MCVDVCNYVIVFTNKSAATITTITRFWYRPKVDVESDLWFRTYPMGQKMWNAILYSNPLLFHLHNMLQNRPHFIRTRLLDRHGRSSSALRHNRRHCNSFFYDIDFQICSQRLASQKGEFEQLMFMRSLNTFWAIEIILYRDIVFKRCANRKSCNSNPKNVQMKFEPLV